MKLQGACSTLKMTAGLRRALGELALVLELSFLIDDAEQVPADASAMLNHLGRDLWQLAGPLTSHQLLHDAFGAISRDLRDLVRARGRLRESSCGRLPRRHVREAFDLVRSSLYLCSFLLQDSCEQRAILPAIQLNRRNSRYENRFV